MVSFHHWTAACVCIVYVGRSYASYLFWRRANDSIVSLASLAPVALLVHLQLWDIRQVSSSHLSTLCRCLQSHLRSCPVARARLGSGLHRGKSAHVHIRRYSSHWQQLIGSMILPVQVNRVIIALVKAGAFNDFQAKDPHTRTHYVYSV